MTKIKSWVLLGLFVSSSALAHVQSTESIFDYDLPAPPTLGTDLSRQDFTKLHEYQDHRTPAQCAAADAQTSPTFKNFFGPQTGILTQKEYDQVTGLSFKLTTKSGPIIFFFKKKYQRPRPYTTDRTLTPCIQKPGDLSYPSGHAALGYLFALALAEKFPAKRDLILKQGFQIGENRLIGGVHHPSDVEAGRALALQIFKNLDD